MCVCVCVCVCVYVCQVREKNVLTSESTFRPAYDRFYGFFRDQDFLLSLGTILQIFLRHFPPSFSYKSSLFGENSTNIDFNTCTELEKYRNIR